MRAKILSGAAVFVFGVLYAGAANAVLVSSLTNGGFEDNSNGSAAYSSTVTSWGTAAQSGQTSPGIWVKANISNPNDFPTFIGNAALGLFVMGNWVSVTPPQNSWVFQNIGAVGSSDIGKKYTLSGSAGAIQQENGSANLTIAFATDVSTSSMGTFLSSNVKNVASLGFGNGPNPLSAWNTSFTPTSSDIGREVYALVSIANVEAGHGGENQYIVDGISLTATQAPEPGAIVLLITGLIGLLAYAWRKRR